MSICTLSDHSLSTSAYRMAWGAINSKHTVASHITHVTEEKLMQTVVAVKRCAEFERLGASDRDKLESTPKTKTYTVKLRKGRIRRKKGVHLACLWVAFWDRGKRRESGKTKGDGEDLALVGGLTRGLAT